MKVTRKVASRRLKRKCFCCNASFVKGNVYYLHRWVSGDEYSVHSYEHLVCAQCIYNEKRHSKRFKEYQNKCKHPEDFIEESYCYIPGEAVMQPDYSYCRLCNQKV